MLKYRYALSCILLAITWINLHASAFPQQVPAPAHTNFDSQSSSARLRSIDVSRAGAHGDGAVSTYQGHDDTQPIQSAINAVCSAGGGKVVFPRGTYNIALSVGKPPRPTSGIAALTIPCSNITLVGSGRDSTVLSFWLIDRGKYVVPSSICPKNLDVPVSGVPRVWRGSAIYIPGGKKSDSPTQNVEIRDLRIAGNSEINGNNKNPVTWDSKDPLPEDSVCSAWDTSNKGIYLQNDDFSGGARGMDSGGYYSPTASYFSNIRIINVHIDHFLGELIYEGNRTVIGSSITDGEFDHSNGDCVSVAGGWYIARNHCHDVSAIGFENPPSTAPQTYELNKIERAKLDGIAITNLTYNLNQDYGLVKITHNEIDSVGRNGIVLYDTVHALVSDNSIKDSPVGISLYDMGTFQVAPKKLQNRPLAPVISSGLQAMGNKSDSQGYQVSICWVYAADSPFDQPLRSKLSAGKMVGSDGAIIKAPTVDQKEFPKPTGWEVYVGRGNGTQYRQSNVLPLGQEFRLSFPLKTNSVSGEMLEGVAEAPSSQPAVTLQKSPDGLRSGIYRVSTAWVSQSILGYLISPPSPQSRVEVPVDNTSLIISPPDSHPKGVVGYMVFIGKDGEKLAGQVGGDFITPIETKAIVSDPGKSKRFPMPGPQGIILSPNIRDVTIENNSFITTTKDMHAGVQCCGTPVAWPMLSNVTIQNNSTKPILGGHGVQRLVALPPEYSTQTWRISPPANKLQLSR